MTKNLDSLEAYKLIFANPHSHHAYFTVLALSRTQSVFLLCPPLQLGLLRRQWKTCDLNFYKPNPFERLCQIILSIIYILFKLNTLSETNYLKIFNNIVQFMLAAKENYIFVRYQDYLNLALSLQIANLIDVCEIIINTDQNSVNRVSTLESVASADAIVYPTSLIAASLPVERPKIFLAPYGGDKALYRRGIKLRTIEKDTQQPFHRRQIIVAARANSFRKGLDIFLDALLKLDNFLGVDSSFSLTIQICGSIPAGQESYLYIEAQSKLARGNRIKISAAQLSPNDYLSAILRADIFIMPSRLEGSSPAALEALWLCTPSILSQSCGIDQFKHNEHGILLPALTPEALCDALISVINNPSILTLWKNNLMRDKSLYTWDRYLHSYKQILTSALNSHEHLSQ
jgi:glycosyltransferase involved in cell wall biosynthesis